MKNVVYYGNREYLITDKEFEEASKAWNFKKDYFCRRLEVSLSDKFVVVETPSEDLGHEVFLMAGSMGGIQKIFKKGDQYFQQTRSEFGGEKKYKIDLSEKQISGLISQEKYYAGQKMLAN